MNTFATNITSTKSNNKDTNFLSAFVFFIHNSCITINVILKRGINSTKFFKICEKLKRSGISPKYFFFPTNTAVIIIIITKIINIYDSVCHVVLLIMIIIITVYKI